MKMKIVQLESQSERSRSAKDAFQRHTDVTLIQTPSQQTFLQHLESGDADLILCSASDLTPETRALIKQRYPHVPLFLAADDDLRRSLLSDDSQPAWDIFSNAELDRLPLAAHRAVQSRRDQAALEDKLTLSRDLLLSCQKSVSVGRLLGSIAHEINNPLEAIANLLYLGQRSLDDQDETRKCFQMAEEELQRVGEITKQILHFHRDSKTIQEVFLPDVLDGILLLYHNRLGPRNIQVVRQYRSSRRLRARPGELRQAFSNLIANAIDAMPNGGTLFVRVRETTRGTLAVTIADRGNGISRNAIRRLGEPLFTTKGEDGTGLGLWVTFQLLERYGGSIRVYSSTRPALQGTVFRISFPNTDSLSSSDLKPA